MKRRPRNSNSVICLFMFTKCKQTITQTYHTIPSTCPNVPNKFQINPSFLKPRFSRFWRFFVCLFTKCKQTSLTTKACTLIWHTSPRSSPSFSPIGLRTAGKLQFSSVTDYNNRQQTDMNHRRQVKL